MIARRRGVPAAELERMDALAALLAVAASSAPDMAREVARVHAQLTERGWSLVIADRDSVVWESVPHPDDLAELDGDESSTIEEPAAGVSTDLLFERPLYTVSAPYRTPAAGERPRELHLVDVDQAIAAGLAAAQLRPGDSDDTLIEAFPDAQLDDAGIARGRRL